MMNKKRFYLFGAILLVILIALDFFVKTYQIREEKNHAILEMIQDDKMLSNELYRLFFGLEDDFNFFERKIKTILFKRRSQDTIESLIEFLNTHPHYFKVRLTDKNGNEIFKLVQSKKTLTYHESKDLYNLSGQSFYKDLSNVGFEKFYFSSLEANIINGRIERPLRPTIRVSKRLVLKEGIEALLIFNIDGQRILDYFKSKSSSSLVEKKILIDHVNHYVASYPLLDHETYIYQRPKFDKPFSDVLRNNVKEHGAFEIEDEVIVFSRLPLPRSQLQWMLISYTPYEKIRAKIYEKRLTWIFWEVLIFVMLMTWFWRDEANRHKEQVVQVLLKERGEFIQNVSHQLKTPLAIVMNYLSDDDVFIKNRQDLKKEVSHLIKVVEDLLLLSEIESIEKLPLVMESILDVLSDSIDLVATKAKEKSVIIKLDISEQIMNNTRLLNRFVLPDLMKSAFLNIIDNAIDFSPSNTLIKINVFMDNEYLVIRIKDSGDGVSPEIIDRIFHRFVRLDKTERKGSGLGLSITKKIIELHTGKIVLVPESGGACFEVRL